MEYFLQLPRVVVSSVCHMEGLHNKPRDLVGEDDEVLLLIVPLRVRGVQEVVNLHQVRGVVGMKIFFKGHKILYQIFFEYLVIIQNLSYQDQIIFLSASILIIVVLCLSVRRCSCCDFLGVI